MFLISKYRKMDSKKIKIPEVVKFAYKNYEYIIQKNKNKCKATCNPCDKTFVVRDGTISGFTL